MWMLATSAYSNLDTAKTYMYKIIRMLITMTKIYEYDIHVGIDAINRVDQNKNGAWLHLPKVRS